jgi:hypothetical protein
MNVKKRVEYEIKENLLLLKKHESLIIKLHEIIASKKILLKENYFLKKMDACSAKEELIVALESKVISGILDLCAVFSLNLNLFYAFTTVLVVMLDSG